jgi:hypothetical protein
MRNVLTPWLVLPAAVALMAAVVWQAARPDCARLAAEHDEQLRVIDFELRGLEERYLKMLDLPTGPQAEADPTSTYAAAATPDDRHFAFRRISEATEQSGKLGPGVSDEAAGIVNRWRIIERDYRERADDREEFLDSWRGRIADRTRVASDAANDSH